MRTLDQIDVNIKPQESLHEELEEQVVENERLKRRLDALTDKINELRRQKEDLQGQLSRHSNGFDVQLSAITSEYESFSPNRLSARTDIDLADAYRALYASFKSAVEGLQKSRQSLKFYQQREKAIDQCLNRDQFKVSRNNQDIYFRRIDKNEYDERAHGGDGNCKVATALGLVVDALTSGASIGQCQQNTDLGASISREPRLGQSQVSTLMGEETQTRSSWRQELIISTQSEEHHRDAGVASPLPRRYSGEFIAIPSTQSTSLQKNRVASPVTKRRRLGRQLDRLNAEDSVTFQDFGNEVDVLSVKREQLQDLLGDIKLPVFQLQKTPLKQSHSRQGGVTIQNPENGEHARRSVTKGDTIYRSVQTKDKQSTCEEAASPVMSGIQVTPNNRTDVASKLRQKENQSTTTIAGSPLRNRPLQSLRIEDFKINPDQNEGLDFAFCQVVRNKARRQCLESCMRPDCCGRHFRSMAIMRPIDEENLAFTSLDNFDREALLRDTRSETDEALAEYFNRLPISSKREKLLDARASYYASRFARHRIDYARAPSPPGFWETDMPSTPAVPRQRGFINPAEQDKVKRMYQEAMKPYGKWKFADE
ncbi:hypothetical protein KEM54_004929 [Ascosphaera aggregata]|nr:hypothetical protein KEM54_004929 [Ascosphaera aggregata]